MFPGNRPGFLPHAVKSCNAGKAAKHSAQQIVAIGGELVIHASERQVGVVVELGQLIRGAGSEIHERIHLRGEGARERLLGVRDLARGVPEAVQDELTRTPSERLLILVFLHQNRGGLVLLARFGIGGGENETACHRHGFRAGGTGHLDDPLPILTYGMDQGSQRGDPWGHVTR